MRPMVSANGTPQFALLTMLLPKPLSRSMNSLFLRRNLRILLLASLFVASLVAVAFLRQDTHPSTPHVKLPPPAQRSYTPALVTNCKHRMPGHPSRTFETAVHGVGASFVSWTKSEIFDEDIVKLRTHEAFHIIAAPPRCSTLVSASERSPFPSPCAPDSHCHRCGHCGNNIKMFCMTANLNGWLGYLGLSMINAVMCDTDGSMDIFVPRGREDNFALSSEAATANVGEPKHGETVRVLVADDILRDDGFQPDIIGIDTLGHEIHVLRGLRRYLAAAKPGAALVMAGSDPTLTRLRRRSKCSVPTHDN